MHSCLNSDQDIENVYKYFFNHGNHTAVSTLDLVHEHFPQNEEEKTKTKRTETWKKTKSLKNEMKCSHSSTSVPNVARLVGLKKLEGFISKKASHRSEC